MNKFKLKPFRAYLWTQYWENRDEWEAWRQTQPYTFDEYVRGNFSELKRKYRLTRC
jgi:hypothetical protein